MSKKNDRQSSVGRRLSRGWKKVGTLGVWLMDQHKKRTPLQRSIFTATILGVLSGVAIGAGWSVSSRMLADWQTPLQNNQVATRIDLAENDTHNAVAGSDRVEPSSTEERSSITPRPPQRPEASTSRPNVSNGAGGHSGSVTAAPHPKVDAQPGIISQAEETEQRTADFVETEIRQLESVIPTSSVEQMIWPVSGSISRPFGWYRHPVFGDWRYASSIALETTGDDRAVRAALDGRVKDVVNEGGLWRVTVEHVGGLVSEYEGLVSINVSSYESVVTGKQLGTAPVPGSGRTVAFSLFNGDAPIDPQMLIDGPSLPVLAR